MNSTAWLNQSGADFAAAYSPALAKSRQATYDPPRPPATPMRDVGIAQAPLQIPVAQIQSPFNNPGAARPRLNLRTTQ